MQAQFSSLYRATATTLSASIYAGVDLKARELQGMIQYKAAHRLVRHGELLQLLQLYQALPSE